MCKKDECIVTGATGPKIVKAALPLLPSLCPPPIAVGGVCSGVVAQPPPPPPDVGWEREGERERESERERRAELSCCQRESRIEAEADESTEKRHHAHRH